MQSTNAKPPDGGWGWMVVFSAFAVNVIIDGCSYSFGVLLPSLLDEFQESRSKTSWIGSVLNSMPLLCGPIASAVSSRIGLRTATIIGGLFVTLGYVSSAFVHSVNVMIVTYGLIAGFGISFPYLNSIVIVALYFKSKRTLATGIAECGAGIGTLIMAPLYEYLIKRYNWRTSVVIIGIISLSLVVCGCVFKPLSREHQTRTNGHQNEAYKNAPETIDVSVIDVKDDKKEQQCKSLENYENSRTSLVDVTIFKNKSFIVLLLSTIILYFWYDVPYVFTVDRGLQLDLSKKMSTFIVSIMGITHTAGNLLFGFLGDVKRLDRRSLYGTGLFLAGATLFFMPFFTQYIPNVVLGGLYGLLSASPEALTSVIIADIFGVEKLNNAFGIVMFFQGVANLVGPPVAGWLYDISGSYDNTFYTAGTCITVSGLVVILCRVCYCKRSASYTY